MGLSSRAIRCHPSLQIASAALLGTSGIPLELAFGMVPHEVFVTGLAWIVLFTSSALLVRAAFARGSRRGPPPGRYERGAVLLAALAALGSALVGFTTQALVLAVSTACFLIIAGRHPTPKQVKGVGLALAGVAVLAGTFFAAAGPTHLQ